MAGVLLNHRAKKAIGQRPRGLIWLVLSTVVVLTAIIWWLSGDVTLFGGKAGFASVSGSWRFDEVGFRAELDAKDALFVQRPDEARNVAEMRKQTERIAAPYLPTTYTFQAKSYTVRQGAAEHETPCSYVGESSLLLQVIGEADGEADDLTVILDPSSSRIYLRTNDTVLPFVRQ